MKKYISYTQYILRETDYTLIYHDSCSFDEFVVINCPIGSRSMY